MANDKATQAFELMHDELGDWWNDDRKNWCAYCGIPMRRRKAEPGKPVPPTKGTRDHVIPKKHRGGLVTIPACLACNRAKGSLSAPEFLLSDHFIERRKHRHRNQWPVDTLWMVVAFAAMKRSISLKR